ncbi:MAG: SIMPL domain-containing protein [Rhodothermales bacterium]
MTRWLAVLLMAGGFQIPAQAQEVKSPESQRIVRVSGEGVVRTVPDQATVRFGVVTRAEDPEEARRLNAEAAREAMNAVRALGVEDANMRLEMLRLQAAREYDPATRRMKEIGFEAVRTVVVEVEDLDTLPSLVAEVIQKGANRLDGVTYELKDRDAARDEALVKALTNARDKAQLMASTLGEELGRVVTIHEQSFDFPRPVLRMGQAERGIAKDAAPEPEAYAAGEIEVRAVVQVAFSLK